MTETLGEAAEKYVRSDDAWIDDTYSAHEQSYVAGAEWMRKQFTLHGTTDCYGSSCYAGRATLYATLGGKCIECAHKQNVPDTCESKGSK